MIAASTIFNRACSSGIGRVSDLNALLRAAVQLSLTRQGNITPAGARITQGGDQRLTQAGDLRIIE